MKKDKHKELQQTAINWLYSRNCSIFAEEVPTWNGIADALGIITSQRPHKPDTVYYIEAKASRSDLLCLKQKCYYKRTERLEAYNNDIDFFYFIVADNVKIEPELYPLWGVINENGKVIRKAKRMKRERDSSDLIINIAHVLVYKVFGKMYLK